jgi:preprotein translocase YajC subunit
MQLFISDASAADQQPAAAGAATTGTDTSGTTANQPYDLSAEKMMTDNLLVLGLLFFIFYFILIRPQQKRVKIHRDMMKGLKKGDRVISTGGIHGTITGFEGDDIVIVEIAPGIKVRKARSAVSEVLGDKGAPGKSANDN